MVPHSKPKSCESQSSLTVCHVNFKPLCLIWGTGLLGVLQDYINFLSIYQKKRVLILFKEKNGFIIMSAYIIP